MKSKRANEITDRGILLLTVRQAAKRLNLGINRTYGLANAGVLPCIRVGNTIRIPAAALDKWIENSTGREF